MKIVSIEKISESKTKLTVEVSAEEIETCLDEAFDKVIKDVKVSGFRPGKMPKNMFLNRFGYEALYEEGMNIALNKTYPNALEESKLQPISEPTLTDASEFAKDKNFTYSVTFDVWPTINLGEYKGIEVKKMSTEVTDELVNERIKRDQERKAENVIKEGAIENGDTAVIDFEGFVDGVAFEGGKAENYELEIGSGAFIPGFEEQLIGMITGEQKDINVTFPEQYAKELAGKPAVFKILVHEVKTKVLPEVNDEFVEDLEIENVKTKEDYLNKIRKELSENLEKQAENHFINTLVDKVITDAKTELPESVVNKEVEEQVKRVEKQAKAYNVPVELLLQYSGVESLDAYKTQAKAYIEKDILTELCFEEIAKVEKLEPSEEEVFAAYDKICGITDEDDDKAKAKKRKDAQKQYSIYNVIANLKNQKVIDFLKANAKVVE